MLYLVCLLQYVLKGFYFLSDAFIFTLIYHIISFSASPCIPYTFLTSVLLPGYSPAWDVCSLLGQCEGYGDLDARQELLAFSLTHCPPDNIHGLLAASSDLQTQVAYLYWTI